MTRWIVGLLICACAVVILADKEQAIPDATYEDLAAQVKTEGKKRRTGRLHTFCGETLNEKRAAYCSGQIGVVPRKRELELSEFLTPVKANSFLSGRGIAKRSLWEECCHEGCSIEEIKENC